MTRCVCYPLKYQLQIMCVCVCARWLRLNLTRFIFLVPHEIDLQISRFRKKKSSERCVVCESQIALWQACERGKKNLVDTDGLGESHD